MAVLKKVLPGDAIDLSASAHNAMIDAALAQRRSAVNSRWIPPPVSASPGIVLVRNNTAANVGRGAVLGIDGVVITPENNPHEFQNRPLVAGAEPVDPDHVGKFVVTMEPIPASKIGRAVIDGVVACQVKVYPDAYDAADILDAETDHLTQRIDGSAAVYWHETIEDPGDVVWAIVGLGVGSPGGIQLVQVKKVSGAGGDDETLPTWAYDAWPYGADTSDNDLRCITAGVVLYRRIEFGLMAYAPNDSIGYAFRDTDGDLNLLEVPGEVVPVGPCEGST